METTQRTNWTDGVPSGLSVAIEQTANSLGTTSSSLFRTELAMECKCAEYKKLIEKLVEWFSSEEVQSCFRSMATINFTHGHLASKEVSPKFTKNAKEIWDQAKAIK